MDGDARGIETGGRTPITGTGGVISDGGWGNPTYAKTSQVQSDTDDKG